MKILILAATEPEISGLRRRLPSGEFHFSVSGIGMVNMALACQHAIHTLSPDLVVQAGICGSFSADYPIGSVVQVTEEIFSELGAGAPEGFLDLEALGFPLFEAEGRIYYNRMQNPAKALPGLPVVRGITVNRVHGIQSEIDFTYQQWQPDVESMEGAACFQVCLRAGIPFYEIRAVSNYVEVRNRAAWNIPLALSAMEDAVYQLCKSGSL